MLRPEMKRYGVVFCRDTACRVLSRFTRNGNLRGAGLAGMLVKDMRVFENKWFARFAEKECISAEELKAIVPELEAGQWDADLGGSVYKQRIARAGAGKSGAYRLIIFFRSGERMFFEYGFAKSDRGNISQIQLKNLKKKAKSLLTLSEEQLKLLLATETYQEIKECKDETDISE
jgi:hypothetical protein